MSNPSILPAGHTYTTVEYLLARYDALVRQMGFRATTLEEQRRGSTRCASACARCPGWTP